MRLTPSVGAELIEIADDPLEVLDARRDRHALDRRGVGVQRLDLDIEPGVGGGDHAQPLGLVALDPVLPTPGCDPEAVDQDDRVRRGRGRTHRAALSLVAFGNSSGGRRAVLVVH